MSPTQQIENFAQSVYLTMKNRYFDEITGEDGQTYISQVIDWTNMYIDELENAVDETGKLVDWWFKRASATELGTVAEGDSSITIPTTVDRIPADERRYVLIENTAGEVVSKWLIAKPGEINNDTSRMGRDLCAIVGNSLVFSRDMNADEDGGTVITDTITKIPALSTVNVKALTIIRPKQLLVLGVAKNSTLPDIVQGGLSPSYVQKYNDLLTGAIARSNATSQSAKASRDSYSGIRGIY